MKIKNGLEKNSISGGKNIKKKIGALKRKSVLFLVVILVVTSALCYGQEPGTVHNIDTGESQQSKKPPEELPISILGTVHNIDTGERFHWIQEAIDDPDTNDHDTIEVYDPSPSYHSTGMYVENILVEKSLTLRAADGAHPIIDGDGSGCVVKILNAPDVEVSGFTIQNGGIRGVSISVGADHTIIKDNIIIENGDSGIFIGSDYCRVENNRITSNIRGIMAGCGENIGCIIRNNIIKDNTHDGMHLLAVSEFTITRNRITNNTWGINFYDGCGGSCHNNLVIENRINSNADNGIGLYDSSNNNHIQSNDISDNGYGVEIRGNSNENEIKGNRIIDNEYGIRIMYSTVIDNEIYNNYFDNTHNAHDVGTNEWNIDKTDVDNGEDYNIIGGDWFGGNYWSDYTGEDDGSGGYPHDEIDGLGDTQVPYTCNGGIQNGGDDLPLVSENCLYSSSETMKMLTTPDQWDVDNPPANGWTEINVIPDHDADTSDWGDRFPDRPWHVMYFKGAHWVYGNEPWYSPIASGHEYYRIPLTVVHEVQGWNCVTLHFKAYVDDTAKFYITGPGYSTPTLFFEYPASISMWEHDPQEFTIDCLQPGDYTIYIDHRDTGGVQYGLIFTAECVSCPCSMPDIRAEDAVREDSEEDGGICLGSVLLTGMLALGAVALNRKKE